METANHTNEIKEINVKITIENSGEDKPTKYDKKRKRWGTACICFLVAFAVVLCLCPFFSGCVFLYISLVICLTGFIVSLCKAGDTYPEEGYGHFPYGGGF